jgi:hypothetical protein
MGQIPEDNGTREISVIFIHPVKALSARVKKRSPGGKRDNFWEQEGGICNQSRI